MGLFDRFRREEKIEQKREETPAPVQQEMIPSDVLLQALLTSQPVTREQALTLPAVSGAVDFISGMIASMPIKLYKYKDGKVESKDDDPRVLFLNGDTGDCLDAFQMKKAMVEDYLLGKGGYCYIRRDRNDVTGLFYVKDIYVSAIPNFKPIFKDFYLIVEGETYQKYEFIKLLRNTKDGATGVGLTEEVGTALETAFNTLLYQLNIVKSGGNKKGFLKSDKRLGQDEINVLKQAWNNLYGNSTENVVVLNNGLQFQEASNSSVEMQLNESKKTLQDEINNIFHIHPEDFYLTFKEAIYPIIRAFTTALNKDLLLEKEKNKMFFEFDVKEVLKTNVKERYEALKIAKEIGLMTINEMRKYENMDYIEGLDVINVGLGAVLYDTNSHKYYTPNTDTIGDLSEDDTLPPENPTDEAIQKVLLDKELDTEFEQSGNSSDA
jgi:HK97 family phage portal protein